jgi:hypothetical protein
MVGEVAEHYPPSLFIIHSTLQEAGKPSKRALNSFFCWGEQNHNLKVSWLRDCGQILSFWEKCSDCRKSAKNFR